MYKFSIGKHDYESAPLDCRVANKVIFMLGKYVSGTLGKILGDVLLMNTQDVDSVLAHVTSGISMNIQTLLDDVTSSDPDRVFDIFELIASTTTENGKQVDLSSMQIFDVYKLFGKLADYHLSPFSAPFSKIALKEKGWQSEEQERNTLRDTQDLNRSEEKNDLKGLAQQASA